MGIIMLLSLKVDHDEELNSQDLLLPWSCCVAQFLAAEEEKERKLNEPEALANTIRARLLEKSQVRTFTYLIKITLYS